MIAAVVLVVLALSSRRIAPLYGKRAVPWVTGACMIASACLNFSTIYFPELAPFFGAPAAVLGAVGIALIILLWSELFGCLNPFRVALYFSGGLVVGALVLWLFKGLAIPWLWVCTCLVPVVSLVCLRRAYDLLPDDERPRRSWGTFSFPWKPIAVMALYSLAYGMCERVFGSELGIHSGLGCVAAAGAVYLVVCLRRDRLHLSFAYRAACPLLLASLLPLWMLGPIGGELASFCALAAYTFVLIVIMVVLSNLTYQYGFNAVWLFGIERAVRLVSVQAGLAATEALTDSSFGYLALCVVVAVARCGGHGPLSFREAADHAVGDGAEDAFGAELRRPLAYRRQVRRAEQAVRAHLAGGGDSHAARPGQAARADRPRPLHRPQHGEDPHQAPLSEAGRPFAQGALRSGGRGGGPCRL